jgi:hypothetical protein
VKAVSKSFLAALAVQALCTVGCLEASGTGGRPIIADVELRTHWAVEPGRLETSTGWTVELDEAVLALGPLTFFELPPPLAIEPERPDLSEHLVSWLIPTAHAHPGDDHFYGGRVMGELYQQVAFDLLEGSHRISAGLRGLAGDVRSFSVALDPPDSRTKGAMDDLRGFHAYVSGTAHRGEHTVPFEGGLTIADSGTLRRVDGIDTELVFDRGGTVVIVVHVDAWFDEAQFDRLEDPDEEGRFTIAEGDQVHGAWRLGVRSGRAYSARREAKP